MAKTTGKSKPEVIGEAPVPISKLPPQAMMNLHHELSTAELPFGKVRFCQHINGACFWMSVDPVGKESPFGDLYRVTTEDLMNAVLNVVARRYEN